MTTHHNGIVMAWQFRYDWLSWSCHGMTTHHTGVVMAWQLRYDWLSLLFFFTPQFPNHHGALMALVIRFHHGPTWWATLRLLIIALTELSWQDLVHSWIQFAMHCRIVMAWRLHDSQSSWSCQWHGVTPPGPRRPIKRNGNEARRDETIPWSCQRNSVKLWREIP